MHASSPLSWNADVLEPTSIRMQWLMHAGLLMGDDSDEEDEDVGILSAGGARGRFTAHPSGPLPQTGVI